MKWAFVLVAAIAALVVAMGDGSGMGAGPGGRTALQMSIRAG